MCSNTENPYLTVTGENGEETVLITEICDDFEIATASAYSPDGIQSIISQSQDFTITVTPEGGVTAPANIITMTSGDNLLM